MILALAAVLLFKRYNTLAAPIPLPEAVSSLSAACTISFAHSDTVSDSPGRTVWNILWDCLATTFACTWVSVHPNVPFRGEGKWTILRRRTFLMIFSILAPEFMIMWAFKQWRGAVKIKQTVKAHSESPSWTTVHGHFLQMGGFRLSATASENFFLNGSSGDGLRRSDFIAALELEGKDENPAALGIGIQEIFDERKAAGERIVSIAMRSKNLIPEHFHYRHQTAEGLWTDNITIDDALNINSAEHIWEGVLTFDALKQALSEGLIDIPDITEDEIDDRSKGDALSKWIAVLQLTWFIVQIVTRATQNLAVTELELTTAALAGLNIVMYFFWWSKPREVRYPVVIRTTGANALLAKRSEDTRMVNLDSEFCLRRYLWALVVVAAFHALSLLRNLPGGIMKTFSMLATMITTLPGKLARTLSKFRRFSATRKDTRRGFRTGNQTSTGTADMVDGRCTHQHLFDCVISAMKYVALPISLLIHLVNLTVLIPIAQILKSNPDSRSGMPCSFDTHKANVLFSVVFYSEDADVSLLLSSPAIAGVIFGAVHCLAWNSTFPSHTEKILWLTASSGVVGTCGAILPPVIMSTNFIADYFDHTKRFFKVVMVGLYIIYTIYLAMIPLAPYIYALARMTLLVLAMASLRSLPPSAFDTVHWVELVPHI